MTTTPTIHWRTEWSNGDPTHYVTFSNAAAEQQRDIAQAAEREGFLIDGDQWTTTENTKMPAYFEVTRAKRYHLDFEKEDVDARLNLQRLTLKPETRKKLETTRNFTLDELAGYAPIQGQGNPTGNISALQLDCCCASVDNTAFPTNTFVIE